MIGGGDFDGTLLHYTPEAADHDSAAIRKIQTPQLRLLNGDAGELAPQ
jgi:hypothetical protein